MTLVLDSSAVIAAVAEAAARPYVLEHVDAEGDICASALALSEARSPPSTPSPTTTCPEPTWKMACDCCGTTCTSSPSTSGASTRAATLARVRPLRIADAIHLAAAERLPPPVRFLTLEPAQVAAAAFLGFDVRSP